MGIYNRDYIRDHRSSDSWGFTEVVKYLVIANVVVFLLQIFVVRTERLTPLESLRRTMPQIDKYLKEHEADDPEALEKLRKKYPELDKMLKEDTLDQLLMPPQKVSIVQEWFQLDTQKVVYQGQVWRLLTHAFCHDRFGIFHIFFNMLLLYWFGTTLESMYGPREFLFFYLTAAVVAGLAFVAIDLQTGSTIPCVGASGAVMAVMMLYTMHYPGETIRIFWLWSLEMRWVMLLYAIWDLHPVLLALAGDQFNTGVAHAAHLGGLAFGFLYFKYQWRLENLVDRIPWPSRPVRARGRPRLRLAAGTYPDQEREPEPDTSRVDELLQKIHESGRASLSEEELAILQDASARMRKRSRRDT